jgi:hypothetical protein
MAHEHAFQHCAGVAGEMEAIRDLAGRGCPLARRVGRGAGAITTDDVRRSGLLLQPRNERLRRPLRPHIEQLVSFHIDDQCSVVVVATHRDIIHAEHQWWRGRWQRESGGVRTRRIRVLRLALRQWRRAHLVPGRPPTRTPMSSSSSFSSVVRRPYRLIRG